MWGSGEALVGERGEVLASFEDGSADVDDVNTSDNANNNMVAPHARTIDAITATQRSHRPGYLQFGYLPRTCKTGTIRATTYGRAIVLAGAV